MVTLYNALQFQVHLKFTLYFCFKTSFKEEVSEIYILADVDVLVIMVTNEAQAESVLYGDSGAVPGTSFWVSELHLIKKPE